MTLRGTIIPGHALPRVTFVYDAKEVSNWLNSIDPFDPQTFDENGMIASPRQRPSILLDGELWACLEPLEALPASWLLINRGKDYLIVMRPEVGADGTIVSDPTPDLNQALRDAVNLLKGIYGANWEMEVQDAREARKYA